MSFLIDTAYAATSGGGQSSPEGLWSSILMLGGFALVFYFLLWRPQSKRAKDHRELVTALAKGDEVITNGGMLGKIAKLTEQYATLTIASNVDITVQRSSISASLPKGTLKSIN